MTGKQQGGGRDRVGSIGATRPMRHRAGQTAHGKRREPIDLKFMHEAEGVVYKRVVEDAEIADVRARDRDHGGPRVVTAFEGMNPVVPCRHAG